MGDKMGMPIRIESFFYIVHEGEIKEKQKKNK